MTKDYRTRLEQYLSSMLQAKQMLSLGIISQEDFIKLDSMIASKYGIESSNIYRGIDLIYKETEGNMSRYEDVTTC